MKADSILADRYQIREQLSQKAGRRTFLAQDLQSQDLVIVKILRFDPDFQWDDLKLFEREATTLQNLHHPAIPKYLDYFEVDEVDLRGFALVQTYINARSLESIVTAGGNFSESEVIELADRVLSILTYLHECIPPVIHRDIKPSNILVANRSGNSIGDVYLVDFGSVQTIASKDGGTITIVGSYGYIPLEQFGGQTTTGSDLYSLGMTIVYLLTGTHPAELVRVNGRVKFTAEIGNRFSRWLEKMTQPHLDKRFESARLAQAVLSSDDGSYGDFMHLKPLGSRVQLSRGQGRIEIRFPDSSTTSPWTNALLFALLGIIFLPFHFWNIFIFLVFIGLIFNITTLADRKVYSEKVISVWQGRRLFSIGKYCSRTDKIKWNDPNTCDLIVYIPGYTFNNYLDVNGRTINGGKVQVKPELQLYHRAVKYSIDSLSQAELWWLSQELSEFLNLELQIIYPTPKLPP